jgi:hypothetical protein
MHDEAFFRGLAEHGRIFDSATGGINRPKEGRWFLPLWYLSALLSGGTT